MYRMIRSLAPAALLAILATGCDRAAPTAVEPADAPSHNLTNQAPVAVVNLTVLSRYCDPVTNSCGYNYRFDSYQSYDPDGSIASVEWKVDGSTWSTSTELYLTAFRAYEGCAGNTRGTLTVTDNEGATSTACFGFTEL